MKLTKLPYYVKLYRASRVAKRFYAGYEHLARDIAFHSDMDVRLDVYSPCTGANHPVLVFMHGGGWSRFNKELFAPVAMKLVPENMVVVIPDHTLYPNASYEQMTHEVAAALSWTLENIEQYGGDPGRVVVVGHSSGGHLAALAVMDPRFLSTYGHTRAEVCGMVGASSGYDIGAQYAFEQAKGKGDTELMATMRGMMGGQEGFPKASPINYVHPDLPPILIVHGDDDQTVPVSIATDFHAALQEAGARSQMVIYPGRGHSEILFTALTEKHPQIVADICDFVRGCSPVRSGATAR